MKHIKIYIIILSVAFTLNLDAQQIPVTNQYIFNPYLYNPARAGENGFKNVNLSHRNQWADMPDSPISFMGTFDMGIKDSNVGIGAMLFSDQLHLISNYGAMASYAYHIPFSDDKTHRLSAGLSAGVLNQQFDFTNANVENEADVSILDRTDNTVNFDMAAGLNYHYKGLNVGVSVPQIFNSNLRYEETGNYDNVDFTLERHFLISASYLMRFGASKAISLEPILLARKVSGIPFQIDGNLLVGYKDMVWLGGGYRSVNSASEAAAAHGSLALRVKERFTLAYTYETVLGSEARTDLGNTHEFTIGYRFGGASNKEKKMMQSLEEKVAALEGELNSLNNKVDDENAQIKEEIADLNEKVDKGIVDAAALAEMQARIKKNEEDIAALQASDAATKAELGKIRSELNSTNTKLAGMGSGGRGSFYMDQMGSVFFTKGSSSLTQEAKSQLDAISGTLRGMPSFTLFISGSASTEGSEDYNMALSMRRANAVKNYLKTVGLSNGSLFLLPYGEEVNAGGNTVNTSDRRVDVFITK